MRKKFCKLFEFPDGGQMLVFLPTKKNGKNYNVVYMTVNEDGEIEEGTMDFLTLEESEKFFTDEMTKEFVLSVYNNMLKNAADAKASITDVGATQGQ